MQRHLSLSRQKTSTFLMDTHPCRGQMFGKVLTPVLFPLPGSLPAKEARIPQGVGVTNTSRDSLFPVTGYIPLCFLSFFASWRKFRSKPILSGIIILQSPSAYWLLPSDISFGGLEVYLCFSLKAVSCPFGSR